MTEPNDDAAPLEPVDADQSHAEPVDANQSHPEAAAIEPAGQATSLESTDPTPAAPSARERVEPAAPPAPPAPEPFTSPPAVTAAAAAAGGGASSAAAATTAIPMLVGRRQFARTTPLVVDRGRASFGLPSFGDRRQAGQIGLVILMIAALGAILLARGGGPPSAGIASGPTPSPVGSLRASPATTPQPSPTASVSPAPGGSAPAQTPKPSPTAKPRTYTVKAGDTLSGIAAKFHTTARAIEQLNAMKSPYVIHPGQVLKLPQSAP